MDCAKVGALIYKLRREQGLTQRQLAEQLGVGDKAVSKWERGRGLPDASLLGELSAVLGVDIGGILAGDLRENRLDGGNMKRIKFYVCPMCGNVITASAGGELSCCGRRLTALAPQEMDARHRPQLAPVEDELYLTFAHPMTKNHAISFVAWGNYERVLLVKLYPEQTAALRLPQLRGGTLYVCCAQEGLYRMAL